MTAPDTGHPILAAVDLRAPSDAVVDEAIVTARAFGQDLVVAHVVHQLDELYGAYVGGGSVAALQEEMASAAHRELDRLEREQLAPTGIGHRTVLLRGVPWQEIVSCAAELGAARIVVGAHLHQRPEHRMLGSTTDRILRHAPCPVVVVPGRRSPASTTRCKETGMDNPA